MPKIEVIKASQAPNVPPKRSKIAQQILNALDNLKKDEVLKLEPDEGKSVRGLKTSVGRITSSAKVKVASWDDGEYVYVKKAD